MSKFGHKVTHFGIFELDVLKIIAIFEITTLKFALFAKFCEKPKISKLETKSVLFGYFWTTVLKNYCEICNHHP